MTAERCPVCDRETCQLAARASEYGRSPSLGMARLRDHAYDDCLAHRVDWRARALKAEETMQEFIDYASALASHVMRSAQLEPTHSLRQDLQGIIDRGRALRDAPAIDADQRAEKKAP